MNTNKNSEILKDEYHTNSSENKFENNEDSMAENINLDDQENCNLDQPNDKESKQDIKTSSITDANRNVHLPLDRRKNNSSETHINSETSMNKDNMYKQIKKDAVTETSPFLEKKRESSPFLEKKRESFDNNSSITSIGSNLSKIEGNVNTAIIQSYSDSSEFIEQNHGPRPRNSYSEDMSLDRSLEDGHLYVTKCRCMPKRYVLAILSFFGFFNVYCLRVDLSVALVAMTNNHTRIRTDGSEYWVPAEFEWNSQIQGHILSAFYYGYLLTQVPGGYIAARFGGKNLFGIAILLSAILTLLTPVASRKHWSLLFALRFVEGLCEGCIYPAMYAIWSRWAPPMERARLLTIPHSGSYSGSVAGTLIAGYLCELCGWAWVFYLFGLFALMWVVAWQIMVFDTPEDDRHISRSERNMIVESLRDEQTKHFVKEPLPWCEIFTSMPFLAILVAHTTEGWGFSLLQTSLPKFLSEALDFRISRSGEYTAFMYLLMGICVFLAGQLSDCLRQEALLTATMARKLFTIVGFSVIAIAFLISVRLTKPIHAVITLIIGAGLESIAWCGFGINHLDIAPRYASLLFGITNTCATVPGILSPIMVGAITSTGERSAWDAIFIISSVLFIFGAIFYGVFASAERQPWAGDPIKDDTFNMEESLLKQQRTSSPCENSIPRDQNNLTHRNHVASATKQNLLEDD